MSELDSEHICRVVIVGGGTAGLTVANDLEHAGVNFVLLERREVFDPQVGASLGLLPNASRILDQVGCYEKFLEITKPIRKQTVHRADGTLFAEYKCLFGISASIDGMEVGENYKTFAKDVSTLSYIGMIGRVFWFVFVKMDKVYYTPNIPRFTTADADALVEEVGSLAIREKRRVTVRDLYRERISGNLVALEEAEYDHWSWGRLVCLGDAIHKMTPNLGAGGSSAIESAAVLSNIISGLVNGVGKPTVEAIRLALGSYQKLRAIRMTKVLKVANVLTRLQALKGWKEYAMTHFIAPRADGVFTRNVFEFLDRSPSGRLSTQTS
ncbi:FAD/NAD(P)-binding domain-containing protein [Periconia macrospinosa]|uniref:FAD/NAD(P)-binding domain-containing protein n=1 Tax=Periconia macrospinosa TaxID=97972 RepID=A0A2V1DD57_9PLEO|nr:FAD/NAD(P)-binding domain-containing protein [Periconia macrospinosa]